MATQQWSSSGMQPIAMSFFVIGVSLTPLTFTRFCVLDLPPIAMADELCAHALATHDLVANTPTRSCATTLLSEPTQD